MSPLRITLCAVVRGALAVTQPAAGQGNGARISTRLSAATSVSHVSTAEVWVTVACTCAIVGCDTTVSTATLLKTAPKVFEVRTRI